MQERRVGAMMLYVPEPLLMAVAEGYWPSPKRLVELLLDELGISVVEEAA